VFLRVRASEVAMVVALLCKRLAIYAMALVGAVSCGSRRPSLPSVPPTFATIEIPPPAPPAPPEPAPGPAVAFETDEDIFGKKTIEELNAEKHLSDIHFELDSASIREADRDVLEKNAEWLKRWPSVRAAIEGHCDSRGTAEYNLALGDRRASSVRTYLVNLGVPAERLTSVSKGKEQPVCLHEHESCWQQNRRGSFTITAK